MNQIGNQPLTDYELRIASALKLAEYSEEDIEMRINALKNPNTDKLQRDSLLREISQVMKRRPNGLQHWFVNEILSRVTDLAPNTVDVICRSINFTQKRRKQ